MTAVCRHCGRSIMSWEGNVWIDPEATGDDSIWRETCDKHDTFIADHEPVTTRTVYVADLDPTWVTFKGIAEVPIDLDPLEVEDWLGDNPDAIEWDGSTEMHDTVGGMDGERTINDAAARINT